MPRRRAGRIALNVLTALSLMLCLGTTGFWVRGRHGRTIDFISGRVFRNASADVFLLDASLGDGVVVVGIARSRNQLPLPPRYSLSEGWLAMFPMPKTGSVWQQSRSRACDGGFSLAGIRARGGVRAYSATENSPAYVDHHWIVGVPYGWLVATFGAMPAIRATRLLRKGRRPPPGLCPRCRYHLTGNVSGVCPECGAPVSAPEAGDRTGKPAGERGAATQA